MPSFIQSKISKPSQHPRSNLHQTQKVAIKVINQSSFQPYSMGENVKWISLKVEKKVNVTGVCLAYKVTKKRGKWVFKSAIMMINMNLM